jgi:outer membrane protein assembly factor BamB
LAVPPRTQLPEKAHFPFQKFGVCSSPTVDGDRVYVVTNGDELLCLDVHGQADGNDGPFQDEGRYMVGADKPPIELTAKDADIIWRFDIVDDAGVCPHDAASNSALIVGDFLYVGTSNGVDEPHTTVLRPDAPSMIVVDKHTGRLVGVDGAGIGGRMFHAQWSSPSAGEVDGRMLVFLGGGDGVCYAFEALTAMPEEPVDLKLVWSFDCVPPNFRYRDGQPIPYYDGDIRKHRGNNNDGTYLGPSQIIATPVFHNNRIYVPIGQDPAHGRGLGMLHCIDATQTGEVTATAGIWTYDGLERTMATVAVYEGAVYVADLSGKMHCVDAETGEPYWVHETNGEIWGSPLVADGKVYIGTRGKDFWILAAGKQKRVIAQVKMDSPVCGSPVAANGTLYIPTMRRLWAVQNGASQ